MSDWKVKENQESANKLAESIIVDLYEAYLIDDEQYNAALKLALTKIADRIYEHDKEIRNSCHETISLAVAEAVKLAVL